MPWPVRSFSVEMTKAGDVGVGSCRAAKLNGVDRKRPGVGFAVVIFATICAMIGW